MEDATQMSQNLTRQKLNFKLRALNMVSKHTFPPVKLKRWVGHRGCVSYMCTESMLKIHGHGKLLKKQDITVPPPARRFWTDHLNLLVLV